MKQLTLLALLLCCYSLSIAQSKYFEKKILWDGNSGQELWQIVPKNGGIYAFLGHAGDESAATYSFFAEIAANGEIINSPVYYEQGDTNLYAAKMLPNELGYVIAQNEDPDNWGDITGYMVFLQVDEHGHILYQRKIGDTTRYNVVSSMVHTPEDNGYLFVGWITINNFYRPYIVKVSANGTKQWEKIINDYTLSLDSRLYDVVRTEEGYFAVGMINSAPNIALGLGDVILAKIDIADGHFTNEWVYDFDDYYGSNTKDWGYTLTTLDDGGFMIGGGKETSPQYGYLIRLDSHKDIVWFNDSINYDCSVRGMQPLSDGSFVATGCATVLYPEVSDGVQVEISKVSSSGALLWKRHYGVDGTDDYAWGMTATPDGGFMVVGRTYDFATQQVPIYLLKTNCMGLLTEPEASFSTTVSTTALTTAFQNLSQFVYPDSTDGGHFIWDFGDGTAPQIDNAAFVSHTFPAYGTYTVRLTAVVCSDTSVVEQEVGVFPVGIY
ncbi:MAG: PKD domain-containing protein, partial [Chitinophagales bacterium]|nr:PKD domain-containing protein [Chitinophagales bacterium]